MAGIILFPTLYAFSNSARSGNLERIAYEENFYQNFVIGLTNTQISNWTIIAVSIISILMIPILFTKLKEKENKTYAILLVITTIMILLPATSSIMNGFSYPSNRWVFAYSFILSYIVTLCFEKEGRYEKKQKNVMTIAFAVYSILLILIMAINKNMEIHNCINLIIGVVMIIVIVMENRKIKKIEYILKNRQIIIIPLIIININTIANYLYEDQKYASYFLDNNTVYELNDTLRGKMNKFKEAIEYIKANDKSFYRIAKCDNSINDTILHKNASLIYDYHPIQGYLSIGNGYVYNLSKNLEDNGYGVTDNINGMDRRTKITTLLATKYYVCNEEDSNYIPYGYKLYHQIGDTKIYINENYLQLGIMYKNYITKAEYEKLTPLEKEDIMLKVAVLEEKNKQIEETKNIEIEKAISLPYFEITENINKNQINVIRSR